MDKTVRTQTFQINRIDSFREQLSRLSLHNPAYDLTRRELMEQGLVGQRVYADEYPCEAVALAEGFYEEDADDGAGVPCLYVQVSGENVGCIRKADYPLLQGALAEDLIDSLSLALHGGDYRLLFEDGELEEGSAGFFGLLTVALREPETEKAPASEDTGTMHYISTTYDTRLVETEGRRGNAALVFALLLGAFYLGFSIPYWLMIRRGRITPSPYLGGDLSDSLLIPHLALAAAALLLTAVSLLVKNAILPLAASGLFIGSAAFLPGLTLFTALPALLGASAALRKKPRGFFTGVKVLFLLAVLGVSGWFLRDTALYVWNNRAFMVRPTGTEEPILPAQDDGYDEEGFDNEFGAFDDDDDFDDDFDDDDDF